MMRWMDSVMFSQDPLSGVYSGMIVHFGEFGRLFRLMPNTHFGGNRTLISVSNSRADGRRGWRLCLMIDGTESSAVYLLGRMIASVLVVDPGISARGCEFRCEHHLLH